MEGGLKGTLKLVEELLDKHGVKDEGTEELIEIEKYMHEMRCAINFLGNDT